jgi:putative membrane protein
MAHDTKWLVGALAAALWIAPAAAAGERTAGEKVDDTTAATKQGAHDAAEKAGDTADKAGEKVSGAAADAKESASSAAATTSDKAKAMGQQATSETARTLAKLHAGNQMEVQAGTWMKEHATNDKVKKFASQMVDDHGKMDDDVKSFAKDQQIDLTSAPKPADMKKGEHHAMLDRLKGMRGAQADREYMRMMVADHQKDVKEVRAAKAKAQQAGDDKLVKLLDDSGQKMESHLKDAQDIQRSLQQRQARTPESRDRGTGSTSSDGSSK